MAWFITGVASKKAIDEYKGNGVVPCNTRTFGFYNTYEEAHRVICKDNGGLHECFYDFLVIECIEPGLHSDVLVEYWYQWNYYRGHWECLKTHGLAFKPNEFKNVQNFSIG